MIFINRAFKSEIVDAIIHGLEAEMKITGRHLIKTETIMVRLRNNIDMTDDVPEREELLMEGARQLVQRRLYALGYFSITTGYFVNLVQCENLNYLQMMLDDKDQTIDTKVKARNRIKEIKGLSGQMKMIPDPFDPTLLNIAETKTQEEAMRDLEADAI